MANLVCHERAAADDPEGLLVLHHGRGASELDLAGLADGLDPPRRLLVVSPRAPMVVDGWPGYHWYLVPRVGYPDRDTFHAARAALGDFHDELWERTGIDPSRTVLGGFSMGCVMSHTMAWAVERPTVAGLLGFSGFVPVVDGWEAALDAHSTTRALVFHGTEDPIIPVSFGRDEQRQLQSAAIDIEYHESAIGHEIDPAYLRRSEAWLAEVLA
jgi:phospholipase/carboxylesterase